MFVENELADSIAAWIYSGAYETLTDVTTGSSFGCNTTGFPAQAGWDAGKLWCYLESLLGKD